jgi:hypothetical protein
MEGVQDAAAMQQAASSPAAASSSSKPLRLAIYNQVNYHLHVVAGAMLAAKQLTTCG